MVYTETLSWAKCKATLRTRSNLVLILSGIPGCLPWGVLSTYFNDFLSQVKGSPRERVGEGNAGGKRASRGGVQACALVAGARQCSGRLMV